MTDQKQSSEKSIADHAKEFVQGVKDILEAIEDLFPGPQPELIPIPIDRQRRRRR